MKTSISTKLMNALQCGRKHMTPETRKKVTDFVLSQQTESGAFLGKGGLEDLYYTMFGWLVAYVLNIRLDSQKMSEYINRFDADELDFVHYIAYMKCKMLHRLVAKGVIGMWLNGLNVSNVRSLDSFQEYPQGDRHSPYTQFLWLSLLEDSNIKLIGKKQTLIDLQDYRVAGGGYANLPQSETPSANATAAALMIKAQLSVYDHAEAEALRNMQNETGGFKAEIFSPMPDLLSTATSLFALKNYGVKPSVNPSDFLEAHWLEQGGFAATLLDERSDVEYVFYGLLALGSI